MGIIEPEGHPLVINYGCSLRATVGMNMQTPNPSFSTQDMKKNASPTWRLLIMLSVTQIFWALTSLLRMSSSISHVWKVRWFIIHARLLSYISGGLFYSTDAMINYINVIMCLERYCAVKYPFKYKIICTKRRIYAAVITCALWTVATHFIPWFLTWAPGRDICAKAWGTKIYSQSNEFKYFTQCYDKGRVYRFKLVESWSDILEKLPIFKVVTYNLIPQILLIVFGILTLRALKQTKPSDQNASELKISDSLALKREKRERQLTKLVLGLVLICLLISWLDLSRWLLTGHFRIIKKINKLAGINLERCLEISLYLLMSLVFVFNPIVYILYNTTIRNNIKSCCNCK